MISMEDKYERLPEVVDLAGTRIPGLTATLIKRGENKALYYRWDCVWEVIRIKKMRAVHTFGKDYPAREVYPGNEEFGAIAWAFANKKSAMEAYESLTDDPIHTGKDV